MQYNYFPLSQHDKALFLQGQTRHKMNSSEPSEEEKLIFLNQLVSAARCETIKKHS